VDCFHEGPNFLAIDPEVCTDCNLCLPECPAKAIVADVDLPADQAHFLKLNAELVKLWPVIAEARPQFPDAKEWDGKPGKLQYLER
jgi:ferredoxin